MASPKKTRNIEDVITCRICVGILRNPKILDCLHSFCETCLQSIQSRLSNVSRSEYKFVCPVCEAITFKNGGVAKLKDDIKSQEIIAIMEEEANKESEDINQDPKPNCDICENEAEFSCSDCELILCSDCKKEHVENSSESVEHLMMDVKLGVLCASHPNRLKKVYCLECELSLCRVCLHKHEKNHSKIPVKKYFEYHENLVEEAKSLETVVSKFKSNQEDFEAVLNVQEEMKEDAKTILAKLTSLTESRLVEIRKVAYQALDHVGSVSGVSEPSHLKNASDKVDQLIEDLGKATSGTVEDTLRNHADLMKRSGEVKTLSLQVDDLPDPSCAGEVVAPAVKEVIEGYIGGVRAVLEELTADKILEDLNIKRSSNESG